MFELKRIAKGAVPSALEKALRYRLLNEPWQAQSICLDVLAVDPKNQVALTTLVLALTDRFERDFVVPYEQAKSRLAELEDEYHRAYYEGIIYERWASAQLAQGVPRNMAAGWLREAMRCYVRAEELSSPDEADAVLRWNTCARLLDEQSTTNSTQAEQLDHLVDVHQNDDVPMR